MSQPSHFSLNGRPLAEVIRDGHSVTVSNQELVTVREAMRGLNHMVAQLETGERKQFVLMHRGRMVARICPLGAAHDPS